MTSATISMNLQRLSINCRSFFLMCKPRVTALIVFTALIGMFLAVPGMPPLDLLVAATVGIALTS
jgi:protoheme IX farnesyltransferase